MTGRRMYEGNNRMNFVWVREFEAHLLRALAAP
jgi:hypothetical protein